MTTRKIASAIVGSLVVVLLAGCMQSLSEQTKADPNINTKKTTQDIKKFDPQAPNQQVDPYRAHADDPVLGPAQMLKPTITRLKLLEIEHALDLYNASEDHYPRSHEEFMSGVIKPNNIQLPVLPPGWQYAYDVEHHTVLIVHPKEAGANGAAPANK